MMPNGLDRLIRALNYAITNAKQFNRRYRLICLRNEAVDLKIKREDGQISAAECSLRTKDITQRAFYGRRPPQGES
jgi:hypothetical protein